MPVERPRQGLLNSGQLPEIVVAHQEQALPSLHPIRAPMGESSPPEAALPRPGARGGATHL